MAGACNPRGWDDSGGGDGWCGRGGGAPDKAVAEPGAGVVTENNNPFHTSHVTALVSLNDGGARCTTEMSMNVVGESDVGVKFNGGVANRGRGGQCDALAGCGGDTAR